MVSRTAARAEEYAVVRRAALARLAERHSLDDLYPAEFARILADETAAAGVTVVTVNIGDGESPAAQAARRDLLRAELGRHAALRGPLR